MWQLQPGQHYIQAIGYTLDGVEVKSRTVQITVLE